MERDKGTEQVMKMEQETEVTEVEMGAEMGT